MSFSISEFQASSPCLKLEYVNEYVFSCVLGKLDTSLYLLGIKGLLDLHIVLFYHPIDPWL